MQIINAHTHTFTLDHVPDHFYSMVSIKKLRNNGTLVRLMKFLHDLGFRSDDDVLDRVVRMLGIINKPSQEDVLNILKWYYPAGTRFAVLSMDMEHMAAGKPVKPFREQLEELARLKERYGDIIFPFICADPRNPDVVEMVRHYTGKRGFTGIKLYPALGYYPFDIRLHKVYEYAIKNDLPIIVHCSKGPVYYRGKYTPDMLEHPVTGEKYTEKKNSPLSWHFTDPINYDYLMDHDKLQGYMDKVASGTKAPDFSKLRISMGHFGGDIEINKYLESGWDFWKNIPLADNDNWFSTIRDLIMKYENFYADVSYTWEDDRFNNILKVLLGESRRSADQKFYHRILFGTDFFLVSMKTTEKHFSINLRAFLGETNFHQIAVENPERFFKLDKEK